MQLTTTLSASHFGTGNTGPESLAVNLGSEQRESAGRGVCIPVRFGLANRTPETTLSLRFITN
eukprot:1093723-Rhodomonas_salina.2